MRANQEKFLAMMANISNVDDGSQHDVEDGSQHDVEGGSDSVHEGDLDTKHDYQELEPVVCCLCKNESSGCPILYLILLQVYPIVYLLLVRSNIGSSFFYCTAFILIILFSVTH